MAAKVLDSSTLIAFFEDAPAADAVEELIHQALQEKHRLYLSVICWAEVYSSTMKQVSQDAADDRAADIATLPIEIVAVADDLRLSRMAAALKTQFSLSLSAAYTAALTKDKKAELVTSNPEFRSMTKELKIRLI